MHDMLQCSEFQLNPRRAGAPKTSQGLAARLLEGGLMQYITLCGIATRVWRLFDLGFDGRVRKYSILPAPEFQAKRMRSGGP